MTKLLSECENMKPQMVVQTVQHVSLSQVSSVWVWSIKHLTINYRPVGEAADEKEQVISCWAVVLH